MDAEERCSLVGFSAAIGKMENVHRRFTRWSPSGVFEKILAVLCDEKELAMILMDSTALSAPQHAAELKKPTG